MQIVFGLQAGGGANCLGFAGGRIDSGGAAKETPLRVCGIPKTASDDATAITAQ